MKLKINGEEINLEQDTLNVSELLVVQKVESPDMVSVQHNGTFVSREDFSQQTVKDGDEIDFLYFMGGGK